MKRIWNVVMIAVLTLIVLGAVSAMIGLFTGASVERMIEVFFGSRETFDMTVDMLRRELLSLG